MFLMGRKGSNLRSQIQNLLPYHLATPQRVYFSPSTSTSLISTPQSRWAGFIGESRGNTQFSHSPDPENFYQFLSRETDDRRDLRHATGTAGRHLSLSLGMRS